MKTQSMNFLFNGMLVLLKTDFTTQWRNRNSIKFTLLVPLVMLAAFRNITGANAAVFTLSTCITAGLAAIGIMGYAGSVARDRENGIFQRLRIAPVSNWCIMASRILVQLAMIFLLATVIFICSYYINHIVLSPTGYLLGYAAVAAGGILYLGLGQLIAGFIKNAETVNAVTRIYYSTLFFVGMLAGMGKFGSIVQSLVQWSPVGTVNTILSAGMQPAAWDMQASLALLLTFIYASLFILAGIKMFRWNVR